MKIISTRGNYSGINLFLKNPSKIRINCCYPTGYPVVAISQSAIPSYFRALFAPSRSYHCPMWEK